MTRVIRLGLSTLVGVVVTLGLFYLMQYLIQGADSALTEDKIGNLVDFVRVKQEQQVETKQRKPKKPPPPDEPPPDVPPQNFNVNVDNTGFNMSNVDLSVDVQVGAGGFGISDGEYLPIVKVAPQYPRRATQRGIEGWVLVEFTITETGAVINPIVIDADPPGIFNRSAMRTIVKWKYKPRIVGGKAVPRTGVQHLITYELEDAR